MRKVGFCSLVRIMSCMKHMRVGSLRVMSSLLNLTGSVMRGCFLVVLRSLLMVLGSLHMMAMRRMLFVRWFLSHVSSPFVVGIPETRDLSFRSLTLASLDSNDRRKPRSDSIKLARRPARSASLFPFLRRRSHHGAKLLCLKRIGVHLQLRVPALDL